MRRLTSDFDGAPVSRRRFLGWSAAAVAWLAAPAARAATSRSDAGPGSLLFRSRPDLTPPALAVAASTPAASAGYLFVAPFTGQDHGTALIADDAGEPVWIYQSPNLVMNFRPQTLFGKPVLTWWEGTVSNGLFAGECIVMDDAYRVVQRLSTANGFQPEVHEFLITSENTALVSANNLVSADLSSYGGPTDGTVVEGVVQEIDIATGKVLLEWHSLDHVALEETFVPVSATWDYLHLNSIDVASDGNLLVSARHPCAVYKLDRHTGELIWRLGGKKSDFELGPEGTFWFQHDARALADGRISLFDDGSNGTNPSPESVSRAIVLALDETARTATLDTAFPNPAGALTVAMGNAQFFADGGCFVGWGTVPEISEFGADGSLAFDAHFPGGQITYRAFRDRWNGRGPGLPRIATVRNASGSVDVYTSWNGSTEVASWRVHGGPTRTTLAPLKRVARSGFETRIRLERRPGRVAVEALDSHGRTLARSGSVPT